jgi:glycosyltransferase involved in cell wall biosynthesis
VRPDVLNIHHPFPLSVAALVAARRRGIPVVATNHTIPSCSLWGIRGLGPVYATAHAALARWIAVVLNASDAVATPTSTAAELTRELGCRADISVISNGIDVDRFSPGRADEGLRTRLGLDGRPVVLYTGRLDPDKDMDVWLEAVARVAPSLPAQFVVGGEGTDRARLEARAAALGIAGRTRFIGYVSSSELPSLYRQAAVYFMTSAVELQSITTLEAAASGLPAVAVDAGALHELVKDGRNGYLVGQGDADGAAAALARLLADPGLRERMGGESRKIALSHAIDRSVDAYERLLLGAVATKRGDHRGEPAGLRRRRPHSTS